AEFLAARYINKHGLSSVQVRSLIYGADDPEQKLIPQLHETVAWLVGFDVRLYAEVLATDPEVLIRSDVAIATPVQKAQLVEGIVRAFNTGTLTRRNTDLYARYDRLRYTGMEELLGRLLSDPTLNNSAKDSVIDIALRCQVQELAPEMQFLAVDPNVDIHIRISAAEFISEYGGPEERLALKPLAHGLDEDSSDELKGYALQAIWPDYLTAEEVFNYCLKPKDPNLYGGYKAFWSRGFVQHLELSGMQAALTWLRGHQLENDTIDP